MMNLALDIFDEMDWDLQLETLGELGAHHVMISILHLWEN